MPMANQPVNPISHEFEVRERPSQVYQTAHSPTASEYPDSEPASPTLEKAKANIKGCCSSCCSFMKSPQVMQAMIMLVTFAATIIMALAWNAFMEHGIGKLLWDDREMPLWWYWAWAAVCVFLTILLCYFTGETLEFGEGIC